MEEKTDLGGPPPYDTGMELQPQQVYPPQPVPYQAQPPIQGKWQESPMLGPGDALLQQPLPVGPPYPSAPGFGPGPGQEWQPPTTVVTQLPQPSFVSLPTRLTSFPTVMRCSNCGNTVTTETHKQIGGTVWLVAAILCFVGLFFALCCVGLIPFCVSAIKDTVHTCPVCKYMLGKHSQL